jgi:23S rRNA (cytosine1962-C5)-methyltransferase
MKIWRLKKGGDKRLRAGHPWVFAGELGHSAKEISPGEVVELRDAQDYFLAYGYANPTSQICFRKLSTNSREKDVLSVDFFARKLRAAAFHRQAAGWDQFSHRWLFAEADGVPGLVVDLYRSVESGWIAVVQASTAGMDKALPNLFTALEQFGGPYRGLTIVDSPSSKARAAEGLKISEKRVASGGAREVYDGDFLFSGDIRLRVDLMHGQKTGFFLDQQWNVELLKQALKFNFKKPSEPVKILDICCYVGQWSSHTSAALMNSGRSASVTVLDSSDTALSFAKHNVSRYAADVQVVHDDALKAVGELAKESFDVVICDPPAFVKKKADLEAGVRAYTKLNRDALRLIKPGGLYVASSCSGLVRSGDWRQVMSEASLKSGKVLRRLYGGGHGPDHPVRPEFPEGQYLKCEIFTVEPPV